jgi:DNA-binding NarL/FixJ family response regulator
MRSMSNDRWRPSGETGPMISVLIVDDHPLIRSGLTLLLDGAADIRVVAAASHGEQAVVLDAEHCPDVVLMDISMPGIDGVEATRRILAARPDAQVVMLTSFAEQEWVLAALDAGAIGYLLADADPDELLRAVRAAAAGEAPFSARAAQALLTSRRSAPAPGSELTPRERDVLALVSEGLANKLIARRLDISEKTVKAHLTSIFATLGVTDRTQAALWSQRHSTLR